MDVLCYAIIAGYDLKRKIAGSTWQSPANLEKNRLSFGKLKSKEILAHFCNKSTEVIRISSLATTTKSMHSRSPAESIVHNSSMNGYSLRRRH